MLPKPAQTVCSDTPLGLSAQERDAFLVSCRKSAAELAVLAGQITSRPFAERVRQLSKTALNLTAYLEKRPDAILLSYSVPRNLEHLVAMLGQYANITSYQETGTTAQDALRKVEGIFDTACESFAGMYRQLLNNDVAALESSAHTLAILMGVDAETEQKRSTLSDSLPPINPQHRNRSGLPQKGNSS